MTEKTVRIPAYAKINLFLDVISKRPDGYHNIDSIMQSVSLCDGLKITVRDSSSAKITLCCSDPSLPCDGKNLAYRAAEKFLEVFGIIADVSIELVKNIPSAAGLGGGSSDCAAVLRALGDIFGKSAEELMPIAGKLGADVPFCLMGGCARAEGIGERLTHFHRGMPDCNILIACAGEGISTPAAYSMLDEELGIGCEELRHADVSEAIDAISVSVDEVSKHLYNSFHLPTLNHHSLSGKIHSKLLEFGAAGAMVSGSGPSVFGIFDSRESAVSAKEYFDSVGIPAFLTKPI